MDKENDVASGDPGELIRINIDPPDRIAKLYDISPTLAAAIVRSRSEQGFFRSPEELARIKGISRNLALTLAPHIDWSEPEGLAPYADEAEPEYLQPTQRREFLGAAALALVVVSLLWMLRYIGGTSIEQYRVGGDWVTLWINGSVLFTLIISLFAACMGIAHFLAFISERLAERGIRVFVLLLVVGFGSLGLGNAISYQFVEGWQSLLENEQAIVAGLLTIITTVQLSPTLYLLRHPTRHPSKTLGNFANATAFIGVPLVALYLWIVRDELPIFILIVIAGYGILLLRTGLQALRTDNSFEHTFSRAVLKTANSSQADEMVAWRRWINMRLPNPEDQQRLKQALDETYPRSKTRTITNIVLVGAGGWLVLTALSAIIQTIIQVWLEPMLK